MSPSAGINLPSEIIEAILLLLPAKSLGRFKSVSKRWNSLISDPQFIKTHLLHQLNNRHKATKLIMRSDARLLYSLDMKEFRPHPNNSDGISATGKEVGFGSPRMTWEDVWGSCNGLVLAEGADDAIFVMNPTTLDLWEIPLCPFALPDGESYVGYGFGYDSSTDDYKIVSISFWDPNYCINTCVSVYSLRNGSWRELPYDHDVEYLTFSGVLVNESLHWITRTSIVAFSLANEEFAEIELPGDDIDVANEIELVDLGGKLGLFSTKAGGNDFWVMEEYGVAKSWTRVCIHGIQIGPFRPVCLVEGSDRDIVFYDMVGDFSVAVYNMDERRCRNVRMEGAPKEYVVPQGPYVETLESPKRLLGTPPHNIDDEELFRFVTTPRIDEDFLRFITTL